MRVLLIYILIVPLNCCSQQWIVTDEKVDTSHIIYTDWFRLMPDLTNIYCGLFQDSETFDYHYYKYISQDNLVYCKMVSKTDSSYQMGYLKLFEVDNGKFCWFPDTFWLYFDKEGKLVEQIFYNSGEIVIPKEFEVIVDSE